jgi:drug/metabolite transporter (DMT)-like permease
MAAPPSVVCGRFKRKHVLAVLFGLAYALSSAGETLAVKSLNYNAPSLSLPGYTALLSNQMWLFMVPVYLYQRRTSPSPPSTTLAHLADYSGTGVLTFVVSILRSVSVNAIPGSVFTILISTSILFNMLLSYFYLRKKFTSWHAGAAACCVASAAGISISVFLSDAGGDFQLGVPCALGASFFIACMTVWQEHLQATWGDDVSVRLVEMTLVASLEASVLTVAYSALTNEIAHWTGDLGAMGATQQGAVLLTCVSVALPLLKLLVRNSKYATIQSANAFFFEFVQASGSLLGSLANILIFAEPWGPGYVVALLLLAASFGVYSKARLVSKQMTTAGTAAAGTSAPQKAGELDVVNPIESKSICIQQAGPVDSWK